LGVDTGMPTPRHQIAQAVLLVNGAYALQLRDDVPGVAARGMWALFGGALEEGESPEAALRREISEELGIHLTECRLLWQVDRYSEFWGTVLRYWFFVADVTTLWPLHIVKEGQAARLFTFEELPATGVHPLIREVLVRHHAKQKDHPLEQGR